MLRFRTRTSVPITILYFSSFSHIKNIIISVGWHFGEKSSRTQRHRRYGLEGTIFGFFPTLSLRTWCRPWLMMIVLEKFKQCHTFEWLNECDGQQIGNSYFKWLGCVLFVLCPRGGLSGYFNFSMVVSTSRLVSSDYASFPTCICLQPSFSGLLYLLAAFAPLTQEALHQHPGP